MHRCSPIEIEKLSAQNEGAVLHLGVLAGANSTAVAALYLGQVLAKAIVHDFPGSGELVLLVPGATLTGYAIGVGIMTFKPAGRAGLSIAAHLGVLSAALCVAGLAPTADTLVIANLAIGGGASVAQRLVAAAGRRGGVTNGGTLIGRVICIALITVLGLRLAGGGFAELVGWRVMYFVTAAIATVFGFINHYLDLKQVSPPTYLVSTPTTVPGSIRDLFKRFVLLRWAAFQHAAMFAAYNVAWMIVLVEVPAQERIAIVCGGGSVGVVAALLAGYCVDRFTRLDLAYVGVGAVAVATALLLPIAYSSHKGLERALILLLGMALLDGGLQVALVANQTRVQLLLPEARLRLAAVLTVCGALGGAVGAGGGYWCWHRFGWPSAIGLAATFGQIAFGCGLLARSTQRGNYLSSAEEGQFTHSAAMTHPAVSRGSFEAASPMSAE